ncbi:c-type cytochrome biogenesis protein CcmI [Labrys monachus]|uniref:Cytochrome c-type biogenesis protein CcmH n=1 Tax=Labrys monachus TaxID=217067 RepID=A0ABU0FIU7_9HYPH|nr:c-type cytochrome biogenesis protein CcmI [Labrys monachus]MDQ0394541.1 cytochrome c-type biogenesis protein CcmH [Labrys monachus]
MFLWFALAGMTGIAALALLWPLARRDGGVSAQASDIAIYTDQLAEIERDQARGIIAPTEAQAARVEVSRRLIEADAAAKSAPAAGAFSARRHRLASLVILVAVPLGGLGFYLHLGSPALPDQPLTARLAEPVENASLDELVARVEAMLAANPQDGRGWEVLAPIYLKEGRLQDARQAYANALRLLGSTARRESDFGEALVAEAGGMVTDEAKAAFQRAQRLDPGDDRAGYYLGRAREQDGDRAGAVAAWQALLDATPPPGPAAAAFLRKEIARIGGEPQAGTGPSPGDVAAAETMTPADRAKMIQGMVSGLASRLRSQGGTAEEWMRLIKAYNVLGQSDQARTALADARKALAASPDALKALDDLQGALGL